MSMLGIGGMLIRSALSGRPTADSLATEADDLAAGSGFSPLDLHATSVNTPCRSATACFKHIICVMHTAS